MYSTAARILFLVFSILLVACSKSPESQGGRSMEKSNEEKIAIITAAGISENTNRAGEIATFLDDGNTEVLGKACFYLGYLKARDYIPRIFELLNGEDIYLLNMCISGLSLMVDERDKALLDKLHGMLAHEDLLVRMSSIEAIGNIGSTDSYAVLEGRFEAESLSAQYEIVRAFEKIGTPEALPTLEKFLKRVKSMDQNVPRTSKVRGSTPHPKTLEVATETAIDQIVKRNQSSP